MMQTDDQEYSCTTPVLFVIFNRPDNTRRVFEAIRLARPAVLYVAADGPRSGVVDEERLCRETRAIVEQVDWPCEVQTRFQETNLGCRLAVSSAISWFFENVEEGIILEDDCLPSQSFFRFCSELLERYRDDSRVMCVAGSTYVEKRDNPDELSYHFCRVGGIWGWATWRRAWACYDIDMASWPQAKRSGIMRDLFPGESRLRRLYSYWFDFAHKESSSWDYQWTYAKVIRNSVNIMPRVNLVKNLGFNEDATNTIGFNRRFARMSLHELEFPLTHPSFVVVDRQFNADNFRYAIGFPCPVFLLAVRHWLVVRFRRPIEWVMKIIGGSGE